MAARLKRGAGPLRFVTLSDGRKLSYAEFGDARGYPVLSCHGGFTGCLDAAVAGPAAARLGIRILSPDRPGTGASTRARGRVVAEWAADVETMLEVLCIRRCSVLGWSLGGPFAASLGALLPHRVDAVAIVAGVVPLDWPWDPPTAAPSLLWPDLHLSDKWPGVACLRFRAEAAMARRLPRWWWARRSRSMPRADIAAVEDSGLAALTRAVSQGLRRPGGTVDDFRAIDQPWGFSYESISVPVRLWHGRDDPLVPCAWSREAQGRVHDATLFTFDGEGHFVAWSRFEDILVDLLASRVRRGLGEL
ncbi:MAG: alpha/beta fold hydrolase [Acidimicrobiales bacterium]